MASEAAIFDFNHKAVREAAASEAINDVLNAGLQRKREMQPHRAYVGASAIGAECERAIQFEFAGAVREKPFASETLVKFDLGHMGEELARGHFWDAGFDLVQTNQHTGLPWAFSQLDGRFKGHVDGVFIKGPPVISYPALWETKSVGTKTFTAIKRDGLRKARPTYYTQVQVYMAYLGLTDNPCIFTVTNLDSGERLHLLIPYDAEEAQRATDRAVRIVSATDAEELLPRPFSDRSHFTCRMCAFSTRCWGLPG